MAADETIRLVVQADTSQVQGASTAIKTAASAVQDLTAGQQRGMAQWDAMVAAQARATTGAKAQTAATVAATTAITAQASATAKAGAAAATGAGGMRGFGMGILYVSQAVEDAQYGFSSVLNNIPLIVMAMGGSGGIAGAISLVGVGIAVASRHMEWFTGKVKEAIDPIEALKKELEEIGKKPVKLSFDVERKTEIEKEVAEATANAGKFKALEGVKPQEETDLEERFNKAVTESGHGGAQVASVLKDIKAHEMTFGDADKEMNQRVREADDARRDLDKAKEDQAKFIEFNKKRSAGLLPEGAKEPENPDVAGAQLRVTRAENALGSRAAEIKGTGPSSAEAAVGKMSAEEKIAALREHGSNVSEDFIKAFENPLDKMLDDAMIAWEDIKRKSAKDEKEADEIADAEQEELKRSGEAMRRSREKAQAQAKEYAGGLVGAGMAGMDEGGTINKDTAEKALRMLKPDVSLYIANQTLEMLQKDIDKAIRQRMVDHGLSFDQAAKELADEAKDKVFAAHLAAEQAPFKRQKERESSFAGQAALSMEGALGNVAEGGIVRGTGRHQLEMQSTGSADLANRVMFERQKAMMAYNRSAANRKKWQGMTAAQRMEAYGKVTDKVTEDAVDYQAGRLFNAGLGTYQQSRDVAKSMVANITGRMGDPATEAQLKLQQSTDGLRAKMDDMMRNGVPLVLRP